MVVVRVIMVAGVLVIVGETFYIEMQNVTVTRPSI